MQSDDDITVTSLRAALLRDVQSGIIEADKAWNKSPSEAATLICRLVGETYRTGFKEPQAQELYARLDAGLYRWVESKPAFQLLLRLLPKLDADSRHIALDWIRRGARKGNVSASEALAGFLRLCRAWKPPVSGPSRVNEIRNPILETANYFEQAGALLAIVHDMGPCVRMFAIICHLVEKHGEFLDQCDWHLSQAAPLRDFISDESHKEAARHSLLSLLFELLFLIDRPKAEATVIGYATRPRFKVLRERAILCLGDWFVSRAASRLRPYLCLPTDNSELNFRIIDRQRIGNRSMSSSKRWGRRFLLEPSPLFPQTVTDVTTDDYRVVLTIGEDEVWLAKNLAKSIGVPALLADARRDDGIVIRLDCWRAAREALAMIGDPEFVAYILSRLSTYFSLAEEYWENQATEDLWSKRTIFSEGDELLHDLMAFLGATRCYHKKIGTFLVGRLKHCTMPLLDDVVILIDETKAHALDDGARRAIHRIINYRLESLARTAGSERSRLGNADALRQQEYRCLALAALSTGDPNAGRYLMPLLGEKTRPMPISLFLEQALEDRARMHKQNVADFVADFMDRHIQELHDSLLPLTEPENDPWVRNLASDFLRSTCPLIQGYDVDGFLSGKGATKIVWKAKRRVDGATKVIKKYRWLEMDRLAHMFAFRPHELTQQDMLATWHQNLARSEPVQDVNGECYLAEDFLAGGMFDSVICEIPPELSSRKRFWLDLFRGVAAGLQALHKRYRKAHTDLHLGNIGVKDRETYEPAICDFGLCRGLDIQGPCYFPGSPKVRAPELFGPAVKPTEQSDIWSLGCVFFAALTGGRYPYSVAGKGLGSPTPYERFKRGMQIRNRMYSDGAQDRLDRKVNRAISDRDFCQIIQGCLKIRVNERYASADEVLADLNRLVN